MIAFQITMIRGSNSDNMKDALPFSFPTKRRQVIHDQGGIASLGSGNAA
jgi:hypothetical protein